MNVVNRIIVPVMYQPDIPRNQEEQFGLGDINYSMFFTPAKASKIIWGIGPAFNIPTRTKRFIGKS